MYILIYIPGTDEEPIIESFLLQEEIRERELELNMCKEDYAIIKGLIIKDFG